MACKAVNCNMSSKQINIQVCVLSRAHAFHACREQWLLQVVPSHSAIAPMRHTEHSSKK